MANHTPDCWHIIKIHPPGKELYYRILASWLGGYLDSSSWRLSSGVETFTEHDGFYLSDQSSGSTYKLYKGSERMSGLMSGIFETYKTQVDEQDQPWVLEVISVEDFLKEYNGKTESI